MEYVATMQHHSSEITTVETINITGNNINNINITGNTAELAQLR